MAVIALRPWQLMPDRLSTIVAERMNDADPDGRLLSHARVVQQGRI